MRIIHNKGVCDPHVHIFNGRAYMFTTHDRGPGQPIFRMDDRRIFSSDDLLNWKLEYTLRPEDTFLGKCEDCYATDAAERNGKYYMYFSYQQYLIGVAVSENSPFGAVLGCLKVGSTGGFDRFETFRLELENTYGSHNLCFVFRSEAEEAARFEDFRFTKIRP